MLENRRAPLVVTALFYAAGAAHDPASGGGLAHFLEHMMFKGSTGYPAGEVDRLTHAWGGSNNAYTTHDSTVYTFSFAGDHWREALAIEADRQAGLALDRLELERERSVIQEEIRLYEERPWDALEMRVQAEHFGDHPYARRIAGDQRSVAGLSADDLSRFHRSRYGAANATLVLAGEVSAEAFDEADRLFGSARPGAALGGDESQSRQPGGMKCFRVHKGEVSRLLVGLPAPSADHTDYAPLRLLLTVLAGGRSSRLGRRLVDEGQMCSACSAEISETRGPGIATLFAELVPGAEPQEVEEVVLEELSRLSAEPPGAGELDRARNLILSDWAFGIDTVAEQAMVVGLAASLFDVEYPVSHLRRLLAADPEQLAAVAERYLAFEHDSVLGWSLAEPGADREPETTESL